MPADVAETHELIGRELYYLYTKWTYFKRLFCTDDETIRLLNYAAEFFFNIYAEVIRDDLILTVCRLTDPASTKVKGQEKANLTVKQLRKLIPVADSSLHNSLDPEISVLDSHVEKFREHRNRRIGHHDLDTRRGRSHATVPSLGLNEMEDALSGIATILDLVEKHYDQDEQPYQNGIYGSGNAEELIQFIRREQSLERYFNEKEFGVDEFEVDSE